MFSCEYYEVSEKTYFEEHLRSDFRKWLFKIFFLTAAFKTILIKIYQPLSN